VVTRFDSASVNVSLRWGWCRLGPPARPRREALIDRSFGQQGLRADFIERGLFTERIILALGFELSHTVESGLPQYVNF
jgi:hypothetical protein